MRFSSLSTPVLVLVCLLALAWPDVAVGRLVLSVIDAKTRQPIACRIHLREVNKRPHKVPGLPFWHDHFVFDGEVTLKLRTGSYVFVIERGLEYLHQTGHFQIEPFADDSKVVELTRFCDMSEHGWWSGDLDVRRRVRDIELLMEADDLHVAVVEGGSNRKGPARLESNAANPIVAFGKNRFYATNGAVHVWPGATAAYLNNAEPLSLAGPTDLTPSPLASLDVIGRQPIGWVDLTRAAWWDLPMLVAHGRVDSIRIANEQLCRDEVQRDPPDARPRDEKLFPGPRGTAEWPQEIYFRLLDCGLRIPPSAGSGSGASPNPVGYNRMYVHVEGPLTYEKWFEAFRAGRVTITNGPLLRTDVYGEVPGHVFQVPEGEKVQFEIGLTLSTREPISYLEIIKDGRVYQTVPLAEYVAKEGR
ncbi:MAG: hypothetical protein GX621_13235, partial [Pirellulaceae bacterium]|nr:hypothetical protein [Pirellulaceae bacterium]